MAHRYFADTFAPDLAAITGQNAHHLARVLRARVGDVVPLCDGQGREYDAVIRAIAPERIELAPGPGRASRAEPATAVTLFAACPKQDKLELILQKAVELGAVRIVPFFSRYCVAAPKNEAVKQQRRARIAREAAEQAGRGVLPAVEEAIPFAALCARLAGPEFDAALLCYEKGGAPLRQLAPPLAGRRIALITGAEGGFAPEEAEALQAAGAQAVSLGPRILRCETAPLAALAALLTLTGELE